MISGVNFQPGQTDPSQGTKKKPAGDQGVQEAIKVLSLRMPRVVGAQALAPAPLLNSPGSDGNSRIDSVVNQVLSRVMPTPSGPPSGPQAPAPMIPPQTVGPRPGESGTMPVSPPVRFDGVPRSPMTGDLLRPPPQWRPGPITAPRVTPGRLPETLPADPPALAPSGPDAGAADPFADLLEYLRRQQPAPEPPSDISDPMI